jgi:hypothetical protein
MQYFPQLETVQPVGQYSQVPSGLSFCPSMHLPEAHIVDDAPKEYEVVVGLLYFSHVSQVPSDLRICLETHEFLTAGYGETGACG